VQDSVHAAVRELLARHGRDELTVPMIATLSGVTPSTIYRRWGDLQELLGDVAVERLKPDTEPADTGSLRGDLAAWAEQFLEEMSSEPGLALLHDVLGSAIDGGKSTHCSVYHQQTIQIMLDRAKRRGEPAPDALTVMDRVVAPIIYWLLFGARSLTMDYARQLVDSCLLEQASAS
jgi:AcrR family transcriptional regulator